MTTAMASPSDIEALKAPLRGLSAQSKRKHERIESLQHELEKATQEESAVNATYRKHLIRCARADCLQFTKLMRGKLPTELQDLVYQYLLIEERPIPVGPYYHFRKYDGLLNPRPTGILGNIRFDDFVDPTPNTGITSRDTRDNTGRALAHDESEMFVDIESDDEIIDFGTNSVILPDGRVKYDHSQKPPSDLIMPNSHVLNPRYVGQAIMAEAQKVYYKNNTFSVCNMEGAIHNFLQLHPGYNFKTWRNGDPPQLPRALRLEPFSVPAQWVRSLQVRVKLEHFESNMPLNTTEEEQYTYERHFLRHVYTSLSALEELVHTSLQTELSIEFIMMTELPTLDNDLYSSEDRRFVNFLQAIRNTVYMTMFDREGTTVKITHHDEMMWPFPRDLTGLFALSKEQWELEKSVYPLRGVADFYLAPASLDLGTLSGGFSEREMESLLRERWGIDSVLDTKCKYPITEGKYWPKGNGSSDWV
ncbi:uncharacterized protein K460DRAFT_412221 [Cucurbitaria berberidis CBS 394.84]|uniref:Uncharacterized protein n=1 Tax=Cucurbitaria berberidis CBS 394.84 TaxID=1168544 RepID=A0A9P4GQ18_9PLEO|nr:uncharacterized protein K460DRAFT_412221 [Cucurbitaria berberidis CBS 394.84]KAF1850528.1 hypothetical protein K460DRAFT_412221 [Cucurbitaria berberidis CBS 394.84]